MRKLPDIFVKYFRREGVINEIEKLASTYDLIECLLISSRFSHWLESQEMAESGSGQSETTTPSGLRASDSIKGEMQKWITKHAKELMDKHFHKVVGYDLA